MLAISAGTRDATGAAAGAVGAVARARCGRTAVDFADAVGAGVGVGVTRDVDACTGALDGGRGAGDRPTG